MASRSKDLAAPPSKRRLLWVTPAYGLLLLLLLYAPGAHGAAIRRAAGGPYEAPAHPNEVGGREEKVGSWPGEEEGMRPLKRVIRDGPEDEDEDYWEWSDEEDSATNAAKIEGDAEDGPEEPEGKESAGNVEEGEKATDEASEGNDDATGGKGDASGESGGVEEESTESDKKEEEEEETESEKKEEEEETESDKKDEEEEEDDYDWGDDTAEEVGEHSAEAIAEEHDESGVEAGHTHEAAAGPADGEESVENKEESEEDVVDDVDPIANEISTEKWKSKSEGNGKASTHLAEENSGESTEENADASEEKEAEPESGRETESEPELEADSDPESEEHSESEADSDPESVASVPVSLGGKAHNDTEENKESGEEAGSGTMEGVEDWESGKDKAGEGEGDKDGKEDEDEDGGDKGDKIGEKDESWEDEEEASWEVDHGDTGEKEKMKGDEGSGEEARKEEDEKDGEEEGWSEEGGDHLLAKGKDLGSEEMGVGEEGSGGPPDAGSGEAGSLEDPSEEWGDEDEEGSGEEGKAVGIGVIIGDGSEDKGKDSAEHGEEHEVEHDGEHKGEPDEELEGEHGGENSGEHDGAVAIGGHDDEEGEPDEEKEGESEEAGGEEGRGVTTESDGEEGEQPEGSGGDDEDALGSGKDGIMGALDVGSASKGEERGSVDEKGEDKTDERESEEEVTEAVPAVVHVVQLEHPRPNVHSETEEVGSEEGGEMREGSEEEANGDHGSHHGEAEKEGGSATVLPGEDEDEEDGEWPESGEEKSDHGPHSGIDEVENDGEGGPHLRGGEEEEETTEKSEEVTDRGSHPGEVDVAVHPGKADEEDDGDWPEWEEEEEEKGDHGPHHSEGAEKEGGEPGTEDGPEEEDVGATEVVSAEGAEGESEGSNEEDKWYLRSEYDDLDDVDEDVTERKKTESEEDPFGLKTFPGLIANISGNVFKGMVGEAKPGSTTTQKVPPTTTEGRKTQNAVVNSRKVDTSFRKMKVVSEMGAAPVPGSAGAGDAEAPVQGEAATEEGGAGSEDKVSDSLITWVALGVVAAVFFGVLGYVYVRGKKTSSSKGAVKNGRGPGPDEEKAAAPKDVEMSLLGEKAFPPPNYYGDGSYQSVPLEPEEKEEEACEEEAGQEKEEKPAEAEADGVVPEPLSADPAPVDETPPMVKVVATFAETPKPMTPVYLNGKGVTTSPKSRGGVSNSR